ncbi:P-loop containing nucleoside triphosphate hydrolase protein [Crassisporium funariophilum]|nr:P-loop containing nucleoside triphosphate hydrolase protein [Crassisporium funariophilum]
MPSIQRDTATTVNHSGMVNSFSLHQFPPSLSMTIAELDVNSQVQKEKSKAKKRYLKRKKERKKHKPKNTGNPQGNGASDTEEGSVKGDEPRAISSPEFIERPRKRPRTAEGLDEDGDFTMAIEKDEVRPTINSPLPEVVVALPSFPLPELPNAPSKTVLALQGLDKALIDAEVVLSSTVLPILEGKDDGGTRLSERTRKRLKESGITELFAVQTSLLPFLLPPRQDSRALYLPYDPPRDVCVSAPTGSGKTLAYVLPIIETLSSRVITRLRALVVLPTRDLVAQVRETFEVLGKGTGLKIGTATGQHPFAHEQSQIINDTAKDLQGGSSKVDILVCTPGRLIDHIVGTPNFSLQHLRYLVIDEADRLLAQSFQDWLAQVLAATQSHEKTGIEQPNTSGWEDASASEHRRFSPLEHLLPDGLSPAFMQRLHYPKIPVFFTEPTATSCQKILLSATLTRDPNKISALDLRNPKYFIVQGAESSSSETKVLDHVMEKFSMPSTLTEHMIISASTQKPLILFHLIHSRQISNALIFTKSAESTTRLLRLFDFFETARVGDLGLNPLIVRAYSSDLPSTDRRTILEEFKNQKVNILVCSDLISRGIDISHVSHVISYDAPVDMRKYVHRVGRTARAGRAGEAWTLVEEQEARYFKQMLKDVDHLDKVKRLRVTEQDLAPLTPHYDVALQNLKDAYTTRHR